MILLSYETHKAARHHWHNCPFDHRAHRARLLQHQFKIFSGIADHSRKFKIRFKFGNLDRHQSFLVASQFCKNLLSSSVKA